MTILAAKIYLLRTPLSIHYALVAKTPLGGRK
nr:MAG TPA: hypothetical protein [Caudoviricetes sp.]